MSEKHKTCVRFWIILNIFLFSFLLLLDAFALIFVVPIGIISSALELKICAITVGIKKYKLIIKEKGKKHDLVVLLAKTQLNSIKVLISKALIDWYISHDEFVSVNNVLIEYNEMKE